MVVERRCQGLVLGVLQVGDPALEQVLLNGHLLPQPHHHVRQHLRRRTAERDGRHDLAMRRSS